MSDYRIIDAQLPRREWPAFLRRTLAPCLPNALPLYRVCQHDLSVHPGGEVLDDEDKNFRGGLWVGVAAAATTTAAASPSLSQLDASDTNPWMAAYINLQNAGQTQIWVYASWERDGGLESNHTYEIEANNGGVSTATGSSRVQFMETDSDPRRRGLFAALLTHLRTQCIPRLPVDPPAAWTSLVAAGKIISTPYSRSKVLWGSLNERHLVYLQPSHSCSSSNKNNKLQADNSKPAIKSVTRQPSPYNKYIIATTRLQLRARLDALIPPDLRFDTLRPEQLQTTLDRSSIPRTLSTLQQMLNVGIMTDDTKELVSWGFLARDGSLANLYTEEQWRRKGLGAAVAQRLMQLAPMRYPVNEDEAVVYSHADVGVENVGSRKVMEKIGGRMGWRVVWVEVDLGEQLAD